jgi:hypothetical protein
MSATNRIDIEVTCPESSLPSVVTCLVNTIVFHRALLNPKVQEVESDTLNLTYPIVQSKEIQNLIETNIREFTLTNKDKPDCELQLIFTVKAIEKGWIGSKEIVNEWEKWTLKFVIKENRNLEEDIGKRLNLIVQKAFENSNLMPQLTNQKEISIDGCFPFKFEFNRNNTKTGWFGVFGK